VSRYYSPSLPSCCPVCSSCFVLKDERLDHPLTASWMEWMHCMVDSTDETAIVYSFEIAWGA